MSIQISVSTVTSVEGSEPDKVEHRIFNVHNASQLRGLHADGGFLPFIEWLERSIEYAEWDTDDGSSRPDLG